MSDLSKHELSRLHVQRPTRLLGLWGRRPSPRRVKVSTSLRFLHEVLGLERLHYGLWDGEPLNLEGLRAAQARYSATLHSWIPSQVKSILEVGPGTGIDALELARRGYEVEGLSPDPYQQDLFVERTGLPFHLCRFQEFTPLRSYDLVLMSESCQYIWLDALISRVPLVAPGGWVLIADYFLVQKGRKEKEKSGHPLGAFLESAQAGGFVLERQEDVTERTAPTLDLLALWKARHFDPALGIASHTLEDRYPRLFPLLRRLLRRRLHRIEQGLREVDAESFRKSKRYMLLLLRVPAGR